MYNDVVCYYDMLGVGEDADEKEIRTAFKAKARKLHPDKNVDKEKNCSQEFVYLKECYNTLMDKESRKRYDEYRKRDAKDDRLKDLFDEDNSTFDLGEFLSMKLKFDDEKFYEKIFMLFRDIEKEEFKLFVSKFGKEAGERYKWSSFGDTNTPYDPQLKEFYRKWCNFSTHKTFSGTHYYRPADESAGRLYRRSVDAANKKHRASLKKNYEEGVIKLCRLLQKSDKRCRKFDEQQKEKKNITIEKTNKNKIQDEFVESEWTKIDDEQLNDYFTASLDLDQNNDRVVEEIYCECCDKTFKSENSWKNHSHSKKHIEKYKEYYRQAELDTDSDDEEYYSVDESKNEGV